MHLVAEKKYKSHPAKTYILKVSNRDTRKRYEIRSTLTIKVLERRQSRSSDVIGNFKHTSHLFSNVSVVDFKQANVCWEPD